MKERDEVMNQTEINQIIAMEMQEPTISQFTNVPDIPELRLKWLGGFRFDGVNVVATELIQAGLAMHDRLESAPKPDSLGALRQMQADVLGGDYYSSRFYLLLANAGKIEAISQLCDSIIEVNQLKIHRYEQLRNGVKVQWSDYANDQISFRCVLWNVFKALLADEDKIQFAMLSHRFAELEWLMDEFVFRQQGLLYPEQWASTKVTFLDGSASTFVLDQWKNWYAWYQTLNHNEAKQHSQHIQRFLQLVEQPVQRMTQLTAALGR